MSKPNYGWPTTRRFPNTLADAFPDDIENARWFFPPEKKRGWKDVVLLAIAIWMWIGLAYYLVNL